MTEFPQLSEDDVAARTAARHELATEPADLPGEAKAAGSGTGDERRVFVGTGFFWGLVTGVLLTAIVIVFAAQNTASIEVRFLGWKFATPLIVLILGSLLIGVILDEIAGVVYRRRRRRILNEREELKRLRKETGNKPS